MNDQPTTIQPGQPQQSEQPVVPPQPELSEQVQAPSQPEPQPKAEQPVYGQPQQYPPAGGQPSHPGQPHQVVVAKDKTVAVLLAVFLGFFTWIYTYNKDAKKFWINLGLSVITIGLWGIAGWIWAIIDTATKPDSYYLNYYSQ